MNDNTPTEKVVFSYPMRSWLVEILYLEWPHGGTNWEYRVLEGGIKRHQSIDEYGSPEPAARDAFGWISDSDEGWKTSDIVSGSNSTDRPTQEVKVIRNDGD